MKCSICEKEAAKTSGNMAYNVPKIIEVRCKQPLIVKWGNRYGKRFFWYFKRKDKEFLDFNYHLEKEGGLLFGIYQTFSEGI